MTTTDRQMHLNAFLLLVGHHDAAWRLGDVDPRGAIGLAHFQRLGAIAERGRLDALFIGDNLGLVLDVEHNAVDILDPTVVVSALAASTSHVGLIATASTSYNEPYNVARRFASIDHLTAGRAGWNVVTSASPIEARNFNLDEPPAHRDRYARADEFLDVTLALWDSWEEDAVIADAESGIFADPGKIHAIDHVGERFRVRGPLTMSRAPQGRPVIVQAGSSESGIDFAARHAEAVFTAQTTLADGQAFYRELKERAAAHGRNPDHVKILPGVAPIIGATHAAARRREDDLARLTGVESGLTLLTHFLGEDASGWALDEELPRLPGEDDIEGYKSRFSLIVEEARRERLTVRQVLGRLAGGHGHRVLVGTPDAVADDLTTWFEEGAADGFSIMPYALPVGLEEFVDEVVPVLQRRGVFRTEYAGSTLRDHYGLPLPQAVAR